MQIVKPTLWRAARIWFSIAWRSLAYGLAAAVVASVILGVWAGVFGASQEDIQSISQVAAFFIGTPACIYAAYSRLGKKYGDFRIVLVRADDGEPV